MPLEDLIDFTKKQIYLAINTRMDENKRRRRWLSFGIRDLLWARVVVGLGLGWWEETKHSFRGADSTWKYLHKQGVLEKPPRSVQIDYADGTLHSSAWYRSHSD